MSTATSKYDDGMDGTTRAILHQITTLGFAVVVRENQYGHEAVAIHSENGERFGVTKDGRYSAVCELAQLVGIDLEG